MPHLTMPPIRTALMNNPDGTPMTQNAPAKGLSPSNGLPAASGSADGGQITIQKHWYRYWGDCGQQINANTDKLDHLVTFGAHADRPDPAQTPNGALYVESDRDVLYFNDGGVWKYLAGTMRGSLSPDTRPTDLGVNDAGFDFRTTDQPAREFIWNQAEWIEVTPVRYGTHAERLAVDVTRVIEQLLWVETDRIALYQLMLVSGSTPVWQYIAGTMFGTLSPDQRPTDLGAHDAGFTFRGTDVAQEFMWSQTAWVETDGFWQSGTGGAIYYNGGNVGIGTNNPQSICHLYKKQPSVTWLTIDNDNSGFGQGVAFSYGTAGRLGGVSHFNDGIGWRMHLDVWSNTSANTVMALTGDTGRVGIGTTSPGYQLTVSSDSAAKPSTNTWTIASDIRTKRNVNRFEGDIEVIRKLDPIVGEYNGLGGTPEGARVVSFDAAKLREIVPQCVSAAKGKLRESDAEETDLLGVNTHELFFHLLRAVQQIDRRLAALEKKAAGIA